MIDHSPTFLKRRPIHRISNFLTFKIIIKCWVMLNIHQVVHYFILSRSPPCEGSEYRYGHILCTNSIFFKCFLRLIKEQIFIPKRIEKSFKYQYKTQRVKLQMKNIFLRMRRSFLTYAALSVSVNFSYFAIRICICTVYSWRSHTSVPFVLCRCSRRPSFLSLSTYICIYCVTIFYNLLVVGMISYWI